MMMFRKTLTKNFKLLYNIIGDPDREIYINEWTLLSVNEVKTASHP